MLLTAVIGNISHTGSTGPLVLPLLWYLAVPDHSTLGRRAETLEMPGPIFRTGPVALSHE
jgi:hypothetical protein